MKLGELFETGVSVRKTVWSKRGREVTKRQVEKISLTDIHPRTKIIKKASDERSN